MPAISAPSEAETDTGASLAYASAQDLRVLLDRGELSSVDLVRALLERIDALDPYLHSIIAVADDALDVARRLDRERERGILRSSLHGIPIVVKDNIETQHLASTAGSLALVDHPPQRDAPVVARLRDAGVIILAKTNLSEWANFRSPYSSGGWSAVRGQTRNPHELTRSAAGSSSGSAAALAGGFAPLSIGTETDGSILVPAAWCGVVGFKPTLGTVPCEGVVPLAHSQDTVGPMARRVADVALCYQVLRGASAATPTATLDEATRIGFAPVDSALDHFVTAPFEELSRRGATTTARPTLLEPPFDREDELLVLLTEFKSDLNAYLGHRLSGGGGPRSLAELIAFNEANADQELALFGQELFLLAEETTGTADPRYRSARQSIRAEARRRLDAALGDTTVLATAMTGPARTIEERPRKHSGRAGWSGPMMTWSIAAVAGYPSLTVPAGVADGLPVGMLLIARPGDEQQLLAVAGLFERALDLHIAPRWIAPSSDPADAS